MTFSTDSASTLAMVCAVHIMISALPVEVRRAISLWAVWIGNSSLVSPVAGAVLECQEASCNLGLLEQNVYFAPARDSFTFARYDVVLMSTCIPVSCDEEERYLLLGMTRDATWTSCLDGRGVGSAAACEAWISNQAAATAVLQRSRLMASR